MSFIYLTPEAGEFTLRLPGVFLDLPLLYSTHLFLRLRSKITPLFRAVPKDSRKGKGFQPFCH